MKSYLISEFKAHCIAILKEIHAGKKPITVTIRGEPLVIIHPVLSTRKKRKLGALKGQMTLSKGFSFEDIINDSSADEWEMNQE